MTTPASVAPVPIPADAPPRRRRWLKGVVVLSVVLVAAVVGYAILGMVEGRRLQRQVDAMRAAGVPMELAPLLPASLPDERNAAVPLQRAFTRLTTPEAPYQPGVAVGTLRPALNLSQLDRDPGTWKPEQQEAARAALASEDGRAVLAAVAEAAALPDCRFDVRYEQGPEVQLTHLTPLRNAVRLVTAQAALGDAAAAGKLLADALTLGSFARREPLLISQYTGISMESDALHGMRSLVARGLPAEAVPALRAALDRLDDASVGMLATLDAERLIISGWAFAGGGLRPGLDGVPGSESMALRLWLSPIGAPLRHRDHRAYLGIMGHVRTQLIAAPFGPWAPAAEPPAMAWFTHILTPAVERTPTLLARRWRGVQAARIALALAQHRAAHGSYPDDLAALVPAYLSRIPTQPRGEPFAYARAADGSATITSLRGDGEPETDALRTWTLP